LSPIIAYKIGIINKNDIVIEVTTNCDESAAVILSSLICSIDISVLQASQINLLYGDTVVAVFVAVN
jgi:hypothetical protein